MGTVYCQECSHEISDSESRCPYCGASLDWLYVNSSKVENTNHSPKEPNSDDHSELSKVIIQSDNKPDDYLVCYNKPESYPMVEFELDVEEPQ